MAHSYYINPSRCLFVPLSKVKYLIIELPDSERFPPKDEAVKITVSSSNKITDVLRIPISEWDEMVGFVNEERVDLL